MKLLVTGQKYKLERLVEKQLQKLRHVSIRKIENDKMFTEIDPTIMNNLLAGRIGVLEKRHQDNGEKGQQNNEKTEMLTKIFEDVRSAWLYQGSNAKYYRKDRLQQADEDLDRLLGGTGSKLSYGTGGRYSSSTDSDAGEISYRTAQHVGTQRKGNSRQKYDKPYQPLQAPPRSDRTTSDDSGDANKHPPKKQKKKKAAPVERTFVDDDLKEEELSADGEDGRNEDQASRDDTKLDQEGGAPIMNAKEDDVKEKTQMDDQDGEENREQKMEHVDDELGVKEPMEDDGSVTENGTKEDDPLKEENMKTDEKSQEDNNTIEAKDKKHAEKQEKNNDEATKKADDYEDDFFDDDEEL